MVQDAQERGEIRGVSRRVWSVVEDRTIPYFAWSRFCRFWMIFALIFAYGSCDGAIQGVVASWTWFFVFSGCALVLLALSVIVKNLLVYDLYDPARPLWKSLIHVFSLASSRQVYIRETYAEERPVTWSWVRGRDGAWLCSWSVEERDPELVDALEIDAEEYDKVADSISGLDLRAEYPKRGDLEFQPNKTILNLTRDPVHSHIVHVQCTHRAAFKSDRKEFCWSFRVPKDTLEAQRNKLPVLRRKSLILDEESASDMVRFFTEMLESCGRDSDVPALFRAWAHRNPSHQHTDTAHTHERVQASVVSSV